MQRINPGLSRLSNLVVPAYSEATEALGGKAGGLLDRLYGYGRVVDVILDSSHPQFKAMGGTQALYGVFFQYLYTQDTVEDRDKLDILSTRFAYRGSNAYTRIPIKGEIVRLEQMLSVAPTEMDHESDSFLEKTCWTAIVPSWNHPHLNLYPDTKALSGKPDMGKDFEENGNIKPLQLNSGDVALEGRYGQSIRFGGTKSSTSPIAKSNTNGKPYIIIRNGQANASGDTCYENVDKDDSSIYLTSGHKVPITEAKRPFKAAEVVPSIAANYEGKQIVANSDRIVVNARDENLVLAAKKHASINAESVSIDGEKYVGLDGTSIYLGTVAKQKQEPVLKGASTDRMLADLRTTLSTFLDGLSSTLSSAANINPLLSSGIGVCNTAKSGVEMVLSDARLKSNESKKVFTE